MKITDSEIRKLSNFSDKGLLRYVQGAKPKINLTTVIEKSQVLANAARENNNELQAAKFEDLVESVKNIVSNNAS